jgi:hypothetical protein
MVSNTFPGGASPHWLCLGIDTYRSDNVTMLNWDVTSGDDCIAIKGVSGEIYLILTVAYRGIEFIEYYCS